MKDIPHLEMNGRGRIWPGLILELLIAFTIFSGCAPASSEKTIRFEVDGGPAVETLREAARQAEVEFIFSSDLVQGLETPPIKGNFAPSEAFKRMLADSPFIVVQHQQSGVYSIQKVQNSKQP